MSDLIKTKYTDAEISKVADFQLTAAEPLDMLNAILDTAFADVVHSFVVSGFGVSQLAAPSMNVLIGAGFAFDRGIDKLLHLAAPISVPVDPAHATLDRVDLLEVRFLETDFDTETRAFKDPATGHVSYVPVSTKTKIGIEARCVAGNPGAGAAPAVEDGWTKLAEIAVGSAETAIFNEDIRPITAPADAVDNVAWTTDKKATFSLKSLATIKKEYLAHVAAEITSVATVHGIRQGKDNGFDADLLDGMQPASAATPATVMARDAEGRAKATAPAENDDIARKYEVDQHAGKEGSNAHGATAEATPSKIITRDENGRAKVAAPSASDDITPKGYVDARMPSGSMTMFAGAAAPTGWLLCNGAAVSRATYAALFAVIGTTFGVGDGASTFNLPDMREAAPVGVGTFSAPEGTTHGAVTAHDAFNLGEFKDDQMQGHWHHFVPGTTDGAGRVGPPDGGSGTATVSSDITVRQPIADQSGNGTPRTGTVTRGKRIGMTFIIKT